MAPRDGAAAPDRLPKRWLSRSLSQGFVYMGTSPELKSLFNRGAIL